MTVLYRLRDASGQLLYVGISDRWTRRMAEHAHTQPWWPDVATADIENHPDRPTAIQAERQAIQTECPRHNVMHSTPTSTTGEAMPKRPTQPSKEREIVNGTEASKHGSRYWLIETADAEYGVYADGVDVVDGALIAWSESFAPIVFDDRGNARLGDREPADRRSLFACKDWISFYAASVWDGSPVAVEWIIR